MEVKTQELFREQATEFHRQAAVGVLQLRLANRERMDSRSTALVIFYLWLLYFLTSHQLCRAWYTHHLFVGDREVEWDWYMKEPEGPDEVWIDPESLE
ncbi:hypothetical protein FGIG_03128 [Fasciola gigantica]|uniref:Uncharacterized protein n=1 Tax=Fasciola gigantica TaxID=46835 RepID=A0A504YKY2_FASGI|nr:hypothetical protein FGIG_03128 [Fasciola gigantica]